jgi:hypothetical protein
MPIPKKKCCIAMNCEKNKQQLNRLVANADCISYTRNKNLNGTPPLRLLPRPRP